MEPIKLVLQDFCGHSNTEIDFTQFNSALIIGKIKNNEAFSNGAGKSTIFNAIEYVLFNEIKVSTLDKIIRDGCDICRVYFEFRSSHDNEIYKIIRSTSKKSGSDVRLFKKNNDNWEDITQRRIADNEKELSKLIKTNYKAFCASFSFSQAGSENNTQKDFSNIATLTPEKRKNALKEALQLTIYSHYEKFSKNKLQNLFKDLEKNKTLYIAYKDLVKNEEEIKSNFLDAIKQRSLLVEQLSSLKDKEDDINNNISKLSNSIFKIENNFSNLENSMSELKLSISKKEIIINSNNSKLETITRDAKILKSDIEKLNIKIYDISNKLKLNNNIEKDITEINNNLIIEGSELKSFENKFAELSIPLPDGGFCNHCRQKLTKEHLENCRKEIKNDLNVISKKIIGKREVVKNLENTKNDLLKQRDTYRKQENTLKELQSDLSSKNKDIDNKREIYSEILNIINKTKEELKEKQTHLGEILVEHKKNKYDDLITLNSQLSEKKKELNNLLSLKENLTSNINLLSNKQAVLEHKMQENKNNSQKINEISNNIVALEKNIILHQKVSNAFSSGGIPSFIINTILDDFQHETNEWINKFRPGLQVQFSLIKTKSDGNQDDTLDIIYILDSYTREYKQLSGAQKLIVSLSLKLALAAVMKKRLGTDIKMLLLDEVDQSLDEGNINVFSDIIKELQKDFKVLVITHNNGLKSKFSHAIEVSQNDDLISTAKLVEIW